jgi:hypothetical protein
MSDERGRKGAATVPPPEGEDDPYNAATRVGAAPADLLAIVRDAEEANAPKTETKKMSDDAPKTTETKTSEAPKAKSEPPPAPKAKKSAAKAAEPVEQTSSPASAIITLFVLIAAALALATR